MDDNYHIRLWKTSVEMDAVPKVVLHRILMEQYLWDPNLQQTNILEILDDETDIYQYTAANMSPLLSREYVVLRLETNEFPFFLTYALLISDFYSIICHTYYQKKYPKRLPSLNHPILLLA